MGTMRLNDVVADIVGNVLAGRSINKRQAAIDRWDDIDPDGQYLAGIDGVMVRIDRRARALQVKAERKAGDSQPPLPFQLPAAVAMDIESTVLTATRVLTRAEFLRAIQIRSQQIANDRKALREWHEALKAADEFWADHPDWSFGQCLDAVLRAGVTGSGEPEVRS
jgi:hypothetical protein